MPSPGSVPTFADFVLPLRNLAEEHFAKMIVSITRDPCPFLHLISIFIFKRKQKSILSEVVSQADGFSQLQQTTRAEHAETAVQQIQHHLAHLASVWQVTNSLRREKERGRSRRREEKRREERREGGRRRRRRKRREIEKKERSNLFSSLGCST
jgi:hypothetical protein